MKFITLLGSILLFAAIAVGQVGTRVEGIVYNNNERAANVTVTFVSTKDKTKIYTTTTGHDGVFSTQALPTGDYQVTASLRGGQETKISETKTIKVVGEGIVEVELELVNIEPISETVTISTGDTKSIEEISKTVNVIAAQEMRDRADFTLIDTVRTIPGFRVQQLGGFGRVASIKTRGLRNQDTAVLIDGIRFRDPGAITGDASSFLSDFTLTSVSRIEVLRGSGSSLYGTNATGGALDFQTPTAKSGVHGQVSTAAGGLGFGRFRGNLSYGTSDNKFGISGAASRTAYTRGIDGDDNAGNTNVQSRVDYRPTSRTNISGRLFVSDAKVRLNSSPDTLGMLPPVTTIIDAEEGVNFIPDIDDPDSIQNSRFFSGQFQITHSISDKLVVGGYYQDLDTQRTNEDGLLGPGKFQSEFTSQFGGTIHTGNANIVWTPNSSNTTTGGYEFESELFRNSGSTPASSFWTRASQTSNTLYVQHLVGLLHDRLQIAGGARGQWFDLGTPRFSVTDGPYANRTFSSPPPAYTFDGAVSYFIEATGTKLRAHVGNGYRVPSMYERFGTFFFLGFFSPQGNPALKPEKSLGIDAGVEQYFADRRVRASATWFYTRIKDEITYLPTDDFGAPAYYNFDRHYSRGAEFSLDAKPTRSTDVFASYTFTNSDVRNFRRPTIVTVASTDRSAFGIPDHQFTLVLTQRIRRFWASLDVLATSSYLAPVFSNFQNHTYRFEGNRRADLTAGYTFRYHDGRLTTRVYGTLENVFDNEYFENGFRTPGRNGRLGMTFGF